MKDLLITLLNTAFWFGLHFGTAGAVCALPRKSEKLWPIWTPKKSSMI